MTTSNTLQHPAPSRNATASPGRPHGATPPEVRQRASDLAREVRVGQTRMAVAVEEIRKSQEEMRACALTELRGALRGVVCMASSEYR